MLSSDLLTISLAVLKEVKIRLNNCKGGSVYAPGLPPGRRKEDDVAKQVYVDKDTCISCELCVNMVPAVFRMGEDGVAEAFDSTGASEKEIQDAIDNCPVNCIHWQ